MAFFQKSNHRDHPRSCGKDNVKDIGRGMARGSPPLVRERRKNGPYGTRNTRITPARAGKTPTSIDRPDMGGDHPRSCGKDENCKVPSSCSRGSPPLVRERRRASPSLVAFAGITPARAGKTCRSPWENMAAQDHPRSCGKDTECTTKGRRKEGSPPLVRERPDCICHLPNASGITPARAGKTSTPPHRTRNTLGSPPLVRERLCQLLYERPQLRITPARAGKTKWC